MNLLDKIKNGEMEHSLPRDGVVNETYITDDYVVQVPMEGNEDKWRKNLFLTKELNRKGVPVPEVLEVNNDPLYAAYERIEGPTLKDREEFSDEEYLEAVRNAGKALGMIHSQKVEGYGKPLPKKDFMEAEYDDWHDFVKEYIQGSLNYVERDLFRETVERAAELVKTEDLPRKPEPRILHMDYTPDNILVSSDLSVHVIDFEGALYGDPDLDLMYAELIASKRGEEAVKAFMNGYQDSRDIDLSDN
ncbi:MAG: phosphotransferase family protein [Candidatus Nanohaloarchaea archaeon]